MVGADADCVVQGGVRVKPITVYCAYCHRPLRSGVGRVKGYLETCIRQPVLVRRAFQNGDGYYWFYDGNGVMECSTEVVCP